MKELKEAIDEFVEHHNKNPKGYKWHKSAAEILAIVKRTKATLDKCLSE